jgi:hypothetical protein
MSRYRKVEVRTYGDEKFCKLSRMLPSGQSLWLYLITGPHTTSIPGIFRAGRAALAEELGWEQEAFDKAFEEVFAQGMAKADWNSRVVWIPNAIKHNAPENPNVVKGWSTTLDLIPECDLKVEALEAIGKHLESMNPAFLDAFRGIVDHVNPSTKGSRKGSAKPSGNGMANQEQEQEQEKDPPSASATPKADPVPDREYDFGSEEIPEGLDAMQYARGLLEACNIPHSFAAQNAASSGITTFAKEHSFPLHRATAKLTALARDEIARGGTMNRFWFEDAKWRVNANAAPQGGGADAGNRFDRAGGGKTLGNHKADRASGALARAQARILAEGEAADADDGAGQDVPESWRGDGRSPSGVIFEGAR